jgi:N-methylhydantoinase B
VRLETPGGGGYGDPLTRQPERVARDVRLGYVTLASARSEYGVVVDEDGAIDAAATTALRSGAGR